MRKIFLAAFAVVPAIAIPAVAVASSTSGSSPVNCQTSTTTASAASTSSVAWRTIPGLRLSPDSIYPMTITVSAVVSGRPVRFRLVDTSVAGRRIVGPAPVPFTPSARQPSAFSFTWSDPGTSAAVRSHDIVVQWRSTAPAGTSTLSGADVVVTYRTDVCAGGIS